MHDYSPEAFGKTIREEMKRRGWSEIRDLQERLKRAAPPGTPGLSYASVWSYVNGDGPANPRRGVVETLAELFGTRTDYLLYGGPRTDEDARVETDAKSAEPDLYDMLRAAIPELSDLDFAVSAALMTYMQRWTQANVRAGLPVEVDDAIHHVMVVWEWAQEPLNAWATRTGREPLEVSRDGASDYLMAALHARNVSLAVAQPTATLHTED